MSMSGDSPSQVNANVEIAIRLGWHLAEAYHEPPPANPPEVKPDQPLPDRLPGESKLGDYELGKTLIAEIQHDVAALKTAFTFTLESDSELTGLIEQGVEGDSTKRTLLTVHRELRRAPATEDVHVAIGLDLGRMLADTVLLPDPKTPATLTEEFKHERLRNAYGWLDDLHSLLPSHASEAVSGSLKRWETWVKGNGGIVPLGIEKDTVVHRRFTRTLHHQGETWRRLLCGEQPATDLLTADDYKSAGDQVIKRFLGLVRTYAWSWKWVILLFLLVIGGFAAVIITFAPGGSSTTAALIATAAGSLGVSWRTVASTLGRVTQKAEGPLWDAEVKEAIVIAATRLPLAPATKPKQVVA
jgi:hypothetical protein